MWSLTMLLNWMFSWLVITCKLRLTTSSSLAEQHNSPPFPLASYLLATYILCPLCWVPIFYVLGPRCLYPISYVKVLFVYIPDKYRQYLKFTFFTVNMSVHKLFIWRKSIQNPPCCISSQWTVCPLPPSLSWTPAVLSPPQTWSKHCEKLKFYIWHISNRQYHFDLNCYNWTRKRGCILLYFLMF